MPFPLFLSTALGVAVLILSAFAQVELWQRKEYRWDRLFSYLKSPQGSLWHYPLLLVAIGILALSWLAYLFAFPAVATYGGVLALLLFATHHVKRIARQGVVRPLFTSRAVFTLVGVFLLAHLYESIFFMPVTAATLQWATLILFVPLLAGIAVIVIGLPFQIRKRQIIQQAKQVRASRKGLAVIGITGSYGKTSTKHFLTQILKTADANFAATKEHHNTPIGLALDVREQLPTKPKLYVAELGAYRRGEIADLAAIVQPTIGVITAIGNQHIDLFGSQENILKAKWESIEALPAKGIAVLNADDDQLTQAAANLPQKTIWYSSRKSADVYASEITLKPTTIKAKLTIGKTTQSVTLPLASEALLTSVLAATAAAYAAGIKSEAIFAALPKLQPFSRTMEIRSGKNDAITIDDSYSANEAGVINAVKHLARFPQSDKRIVLLPLIELGQDAKPTHMHIGKEIKQAQAKLFVYGTEYQKQLGPGTYITDPEQLAKLVATGLSKDTVILLENRIPEIVRAAVLA